MNDEAPATASASPVGHEIESLKGTIVRAGAVLLSYWPGAKAGAGRELGIVMKGDGSPVSEADLASNDILTAGIREIFPNDGIVSEEITAEEPYSAHENVWIIDPLDGTKAFISGNDDFSILAGRIRGGVTTHGIMYFPARDVMIVGEAGKGAFANGVPLKVSASTTPRTHSIYHRNLRNTFDDTRLFPDHLDSGLAFHKVAAGEFDGVIMRMTTHREWDLAAPAGVITEAGGLVTDEHGERIRFDSRGVYFEYVVASNGSVHRDLLELVARDR